MICRTWPLVCLLVFAVALWQVRDGVVLRVRDTDGTLLLTAPLPHGAEFGIRFIHSVARSPVEEWFCAKDGNIALSRTIYKDFGAGLPHEALEGQRMVFADGHMEISGYTLLLPRLDVRVGRVAQHELLLPAVASGPFRIVPFSTLAPPGAALTFLLEYDPWGVLAWRVRALVAR